MSKNVQIERMKIGKLKATKLKGHYFTLQIKITHTCNHYISLLN